MKNSLILLIKGFLIGVAKIIPGVSGAMLAISFGIYDKAINAINYFFHDIKKNVKFLIPIGIGVFLAIVLTSKIVLISLDKYFLPTMLLFIGLITGGIPMIFKKVEYNYTKKNILIAVIIFLLIISIPLIKPNSDVIVFNLSISSFILLILIGMIDAFTMVVPGISGTAIMMIIGCYEPLMQVFSNLSDFSLILTNLYILFPFGIGVLFGIIITVKLISYLFKHYEIKTFFAIIGFVISSVFLLLIKTFNGNYNLQQILVGLLLFIVGYYLSLNFDKE